MALLASKTPEGMLGLRWAKLKMGPVHSTQVKSVQVRFTTYPEACQHVAPACALL